MDWAQAAAYLSDQATGLSDPPDDPRLDDDYDFWRAVEQLVESTNGVGGLQEAVPPRKEGAQDIWREILHPRGRHGQWIRKMDDVVAQAHEGENDRLAQPYIAHVRAVADSVSPQARGVAYFHDALEDPQMTPDKLADMLEGDEIEAVKLLARPQTDDEDAYQRYIDKLAAAPGKPGELAREVKVADLQHMLGRMQGAGVQQDRQRYETALAKLQPAREPLPSSAVYSHRPGELTEAGVEAQYRDMYEAALASGHAAIDRDWYRNQHDLIYQTAAKLDPPVDGAVLAAMVAATSPHTVWITRNTKRYVNLELAVKAVRKARANPDMPAPELAKQPAPGMLTRSLEDAVRLYRGEDPAKVLSAPKTRSFYNNLLRPEESTTTTVDELMARATLGITSREHYGQAAVGVRIGNQAGSPTSGYRWVAERVENLCRTLNAQGAHLQPQQLQAIIWCEQQRRQYATDDAEKAAE